MSGSGYDDNSRAAAQQLLARAQAGDKDAAAQLFAAAHPGGWRPGHQNAAIDAYNEFTPGTQGDLSHINASHGFMGDVGHGIGSVVQKLSPLAAFIPGVGPIAAGAIAAGGNSLGSEMQGHGLDLGNSLLKGGLAGVGNKLMQKPSQPLPGEAPAETLVGGSNGVPLSGTGPAQAQSGIQQLVGQFKDPSGKLDITKLGQVGGAGLGLIEKRNARMAQERNANAMLQVQRSQLAQGEQGYADKEGLRQMALKKLSGLGNGGSSIFGGGSGY